MNYSFFDYKYNIIGYNGEHFGSEYQTIYLISAVVLSFFLALIFRNVKKEKVDRALAFIGVGLTLLYIIKTLWESHFDVATGRGFNTYLLPFDTCSIAMWACLIGGFGKGWFADWAKKWAVTVGFAGGFANALFLNGLKYYPFFTFGAFYSMIWHAVMIFVAWWLLMSGDVKMKWTDIFRAFGFHVIFSALPIAINYCISHMNWMLYDDAGGVPLVEKICEPYANTWVATLIMLLSYLFAIALLTSLYILLGKVVGLFRKNKLGLLIHS